MPVSNLAPALWPASVLPLVCLLPACRITTYFGEMNETIENTKEALGHLLEAYSFPRGNADAALTARGLATFSATQLT